MPLDLLVDDHINFDLFNLPLPHVGEERIERYNSLAAALFQTNNIWVTDRYDGLNKRSQFIADREEFANYYATVCADSRVLLPLLSGLHIETSQVAGNFDPKVPEGKKYALNFGHFECGACGVAKDGGLGGDTDLARLVNDGNVNGDIKKNAWEQAERQIKENKHLKASVALMYHDDGSIEVLGMYRRRENGQEGETIDRSTLTNDGVRILAGKEKAVPLQDLYKTLVKMLDYNESFKGSYKPAATLHKGGQSPAMHEIVTNTELPSLAVSTGSIMIEGIQKVFSSQGGAEHQGQLGSLDYALMDHHDSRWSPAVIQGSSKADILAEAQRIKQAQKEGRISNLDTYLENGGYFIGVDVGTGRNIGKFKNIYFIDMNKDKPEIMHSVTRKQGLAYTAR